MPELLKILEEVKAQHEKLTDEIRTDVTIDPTVILRRIKATTTMEDPTQTVQKTLNRMSKKISDDLSRQINKIIGSRGKTSSLRTTGLAIGQAISGALTGEGRSLITMIEQGFISQNVSLIKSIAEEYHNKVEHTVWSALREGKSTTEFQEELQHAYNLSSNRARLIARDQSGKLYGQLNKVRQEDVGIKHFIWRTVRDNRVREAHRKLEGKKFSWEEGANGLFPGQDYQCRCWAEPDPEDILGKG